MRNDTASLMGSTGELKRISSALTFFQKRVFPIFWFGGFAVVFAVAAREVFLGNNPNGGPPVVFLLGPCVIAAFGYFLMKALWWNLMDEVWDAGDALIVRNNSKEERVEFGNIKNISYASLSNPPRVTLHLRDTGLFGAEMSFMPPSSGAFFPWTKRNPLIEDLIQRVDMARGRAGPLPASSNSD